MLEPTGKVAFATGAASGIGLGMVRAFTGAGMAVMMADIEAAPLERAQTRIANPPALRITPFLKGESGPQADWQTLLKSGIAQLNGTSCRAAP